MTTITITIPFPMLATLFQDEIKRTGPISLARFMELALYAPGLGYYETRQEIGRKGDFYTSVSVGSLFGELLALQFAHWLEAPRFRCGQVQMVEAGAHNGQLAHDILTFLRHHDPALFSRLEYWIIEPSPKRQDWQMENLSKAQFKNVKWLSGIGDLAAAGVHGVVFSNELLDAMPAHRLGWNAAGRKWFEWRIACDHDRFSWERMALPEALKHWAPALPTALEEVLPDQFTFEISPQAAQWWEQAASALRQGVLMTIDYGLTQQELIVPQRTGGTLRSYSKHSPSPSIFDNIGQQDITAHINFSDLQAAGEQCGLKTRELVSQGKFLTEIVCLFQSNDILLNLGKPLRARQFATLTHPEHLGERFRVFHQIRDNAAR